MAATDVYTQTNTDELLATKADADDLAAETTRAEAAEAANATAADAAQTTANAAMPQAGGTGTGTWDLTGATVEVATAEADTNDTTAASTAFVQEAVTTATAQGWTQITSFASGWADYHTVDSTFPTCAVRLNAGKVETRGILYNATGVTSAPQDMISALPSGGYTPGENRPFATIAGDNSSSNAAVAAIAHPTGVLSLLNLGGVATVKIVSLWNGGWVL